MPDLHPRRIPVAMRPWLTGSGVKDLGIAAGR